jgi:hypothetical protein
MLLRTSIFWALLLSFFYNLSGAPEVHAHKVALSSGLYSLTTADPDTGSTVGSIGVGAYQLQYSLRVIPRLSVEVGYFVILSEGLAGLDSNGIELGTAYYPLSDAEARSFRDDYLSLKVSDIWRPYVGAFFVQRTVVSASFAGYGVKGGTEWVFKAPLMLKVEGRFVSYSNTLSPAITELTGNIGIGIEF